MSVGLLLPVSDIRLSPEKGDWGGAVKCLAGIHSLLEDRMRHKKLLRKLVHGLSKPVSASVRGWLDTFRIFL